MKNNDKESINPLQKKTCNSLATHWRCPECHAVFPDGCNFCALCGVKLETVHITSMKDYLNSIKSKIHHVVQTSVPPELCKTQPDHDTYMPLQKGVMVFFKNEASPSQQASQPAPSAATNKMQKQNTHQIRRGSIVELGRKVLERFVLG